MYAMAFSRGNIGQAASSAMVMMIVIFAIIVPYLYSELREKMDNDQNLNNKKSFGKNFF